MAIGTGIFLVALGAVLKYAVADSVDGVDLATVGVILMIAGIAGIILSFLLSSMWRDRGGEAVVRERHYGDPPRV